MPTVDLTLPSVAAANAANETAGGAVQGIQYADAQHLAQAHLALLQKSEADRNALEQSEEQRRRDALARLDQQTQGENDFLGQAIGNMAGPAPTTSPAVVGPHTRDQADPSETAQVTSKFQEHARQVLDFSKNLSPTARNVYLGHFLPMLQGEHADEQYNAAVRAEVRSAEELMQTGGLQPDEQAVLQHGLQGLMAGTEDLKTYSAAKDDIVKAASRRFTRQTTLQAGTAFMQQMQQMGGMAIDPAALAKPYADWVARPNGTLDELKATLTPIAFGIKPQRVKIGGLDLPAPSNRPEDRGAYLSQVFPALNAQAQSDALAELAKDPEIAAALKDGTIGDPKAYTAKRDALVRSKAEGIAAQLGYSPDEVDQVADQYTSAQQQRATVKQYKALPPEFRNTQLPPDQAIQFFNEAKLVPKNAPQQQIDALRAKYGLQAPAQQQNARDPDGFPIDLSRPVIKNEDGSISTERTMTIEADGKFYNVPTIVGGKAYSMPEAEQLMRAGKNPPVSGPFDSEDAAIASAKRRSARIGELRPQESSGGTGASAPAKPSKSSAAADDSLKPKYITKPEYLYPGLQTGRTGGQTQDEAANVLRDMAKDTAKAKKFAEKGGVSSSPGRADRTGQDEYEMASGKLEQAISEYEKLYGDVPASLKKELDRLRGGK